MLTVCAREGIKIAPNALDIIIESSRRDLRQTLHNLYTWTATKKSMNYDEAKANASRAEKDSIKMGPFEATRLMFGEPKKPADFVREKMDLYFEDYSFVPLFVFENYLKIQLHGNFDKYQTLDRFTRAADSLSQSDLIDASVRSKQQWSLLPQHVSIVVSSHFSLKTPLCTGNTLWYCRFLVVSKQKKIQISFPPGKILATLFLKCQLL